MSGLPSNSRVSITAILRAFMLRTYVAMHDAEKAIQLVWSLSGLRSRMKSVPSFWSMAIALMLGTNA